MYRDPWAKKTQKALRTISKVGNAIAKAHAQVKREQKRAAREAERRATAYNRMLIKNERERIRQLKQAEVAIRRAERERAKAEREREKALILQQKLQEQRLFEAEALEVQKSNMIWANVHKFIDDMVTLQDINDTIARCEYEINNDVEEGFFEKQKPILQPVRQIAEKEAELKYNLTDAQLDVTEAENSLRSYVFEEIEPTRATVEELLAEEAKENISCFFPWKQKRLRKEYILSKIDSRYQELHTSWKVKKDSYDERRIKLLASLSDKQRILDKTKKEKIKFISDRTKELYDIELNVWRSERDEFYSSFKRNFLNVIDGDKDYVITAIDSVFPDEDLPMEYFVDAIYDDSNGKVYVDLDLPEIEDIPDQKIVLTSTGKKSIRSKSQTDLRSDYAHCVLGLAMNVAFSIFNVSLKIKEVEIMGYTQRKEDNSAIATDQYVFVINFDRDTFARIDFKRLSAVQIIDFFKHHINLSKSFVMKEIDLSNAFDKMYTFNVADYDDFIKSLPIEQQTTKPSSTPNKNQQSSSKSNTSSSIIYVDDAPIESFNKSSLFVTRLYSFIDRLSKNSGINRHADNLNGVRITMTGGNFSGDGNTTTYRGKLFFCSIMDLFKCLVMMQINLDNLTPPNYPLAKYALKIFGQLTFQFITISSVEKSYRSLIDMLRQMESGIPTSPHVFLLAEVLCDYENDLSWYHQYLDLIGEFVDIVKSSVHSNLLSRLRIENFLKHLKSQGISLPNIV